MDDDDGWVVLVTSAIIRCAARATRNELRVAPSTGRHGHCSRTQVGVRPVQSSPVRGLFTPINPDVIRFLPAIKHELLPALYVKPDRMNK
jgi:hypothetical protein